MKKNEAINYLKAIGIIFVVLGHCLYGTGILSRFVYLLNLPIFFIVSGYLYKYKDEKTNNVWAYLGNKIGRFWKYYLFYGVILVLFHNLFLKMGIISSVYQLYTIREFVFGICNSALFISNEPFSAAMWFIPVLIIALTIFNAIIVFSKRYGEKKQVCIQIIGVLLVSLFGYCLSIKNINIGLHYQTSLFIEVFILIGYYFKSYEKNIDIFFDKYRFTKVIFILCSFVGSIATIYFKDAKIDMAANSILYPVSFVIMASCLTISIYYICQAIYKFNIPTFLKKIITIISEHTIQIMCLHFLIIKMVDYVYCSIRNDYTFLSKFPFSNQKLILLYLLFGILIPILIKKTIDKILNKIKKSNMKIKKLNLKKIDKKSFIIICISFIIILMYFIFIIKRNHFIFYWDYITYWNNALDLEGYLNNSTIDFVVNIIKSVLYTDYNLLAATLPAVFMKFMGNARIVYVLSIILLYLFPSIVVCYKNNIENRRILLLLLIILPAAPLVFYLTNFGFIDVGGLLIINLIILYFYKKKKYGISGVLLLVLYFFRRWYMFFVLSFIVANGIIDLICMKKNINELKKIIVKYIKVAIPPIIIIFATVLLHFICFKDLYDKEFFYLYKLLFVNYGDMYSAYKFSILTDFDFIISSFGVIVLLIYLTSIIICNVKRKYRREVNTIALQIIMCMVFFIKTQSHGPHHLLLYVPGIVCSIIYMFKALKSNCIKMTILSLLIINCLLLVYPISNSKVTNKLMEYKIISQYKMEPLVSSNVDEVGEVNEMINNNFKNRKIYVNSSSVIFNDSIIRNYDRSINDNFDSRDFYVYPVHVDKRDGYPYILKDCDVIITSKIDQLHLAENEQKTIKYINKVFKEKKSIYNCYYLYDSFSISNQEFYIYVKKDDNEIFDKQFEKFMNDYFKFMEE